MSTPAAPILGPCTAWISGADVAACRGDTTASDAVLYDDVAVQASMLLYELSGRQFSGLCERTVRPGRVGCGCWAGIPADVALPATWGSWGGYGWGWWGEGHRFGCEALSRVKLAGYPVREIVEVKIGGTVLPELDTGGQPNWRLDDWRWLTRMGETVNGVVQARRWPGCSRLDVEDTEPGTFSISYRHGVDPPPLGAQAAAQLASELFNACGGGDCKLPARVTRVVRQGVTLDRVVAAALAFREGATGLQLVDAFLAAYGLTGRRRPSVWSPDVPPFPRTLGT
jgi:hypothetical protein